MGSSITHKCDEEKTMTKLKDRKEPTGHRQGKLVKFVDTIHALTKLMSSEEKLVVADKDDIYGDRYVYNPQLMEKMIEIIREIDSFDKTEHGDLYLTSGGRIVLDKGYGEYFNDSGDTVVLSLEQLGKGVKLEVFKEMIARAEKLREVKINR